MSSAMDIPRLRLTGLTFSLLEDTGYYTDVDYAYAEDSFWGAGRGCKFARGDVVDACQNYTCDFYGRYGRVCTAPNGSYPLKDIPASKFICENPGNEVEFRNFGYDFGPDSRCFVASVQTGLTKTPPVASCYRSTCISNNRTINITVGGVVATCLTPSKMLIYLDQVLNIGGTTLRCPAHFNTFCSYKPCPNWCSGRGLCIKNRCLCSSKFSGADCSVTR